MDVLRARAYLDLLLGQDSRPCPGDGPAQQDVAPGGFAVRGTLTVPLADLTGAADRPGQLSGIGPVDPWLARDLAAAAARNPRTSWCVTPVDEHGHAAFHGCARPEPRNRRPDPGTARDPGDPHHAGSAGDGTNPGQRPGRRETGRGPAWPARAGTGGTGRGSASPANRGTGRRAGWGPGGCAPPDPAPTSSSNSTPSTPRTATTGSPPPATTPAPSSGT